MKKTNFIATVILFWSLTSVAQESNQTIDPSKPTNLYTQFNTLTELNSYDTFNTYGIRLNFQYAIDTDNLILVELPFLRNDATNETGLSDMRFRYFERQNEM